MNITPQLFEAFLHCPTKCWLKAAGEHGTGNAYADWVEAENEKYRAAGLECLRSTAPEDDVALSPLADGLKEGKWRTAVNVLVETEKLESPIHAVERVPSEGRGRPARFIPVRFIPRNKVTKEDKLLVAFDSLALAGVLGRTVDIGKIIHGDDHATLKVKIAPVIGKVRTLLESTAALLCGTSSPHLILNRHCPECEFRDQCRRKAIDEDELSLLAGMSDKDRKDCNNKGIFTVTQLSYIFRPRRRPKHLRGKREKYHPSLKTLAIREKKVYVVGNPTLEMKGTPVYLDVEALRYSIPGPAAMPDQIQAPTECWAG